MSPAAAAVNVQINQEIAFTSIVTKDMERPRPM